MNVTKIYWITLCLIILAGCSNSENGSNNGNSSDGHAHPSHGPHEGDLIELGDEEFHAEFIHDEQAGSVTIYILDSSAKKNVAIDATEVTINLKHDGKAEQHKLPASPEKEDEQGKSSRFVSTDKELAEEIEHNHGGATLVVTIKGKQYRGKIEHDHH